MIKWSDGDYRALIEAARQIGARPLDLLLVLYSESGLNPNAIAYVAGAPYARGLNQITPPNAKAMGLSDEDWESLSRGMSPREQLPYVVRSIQAATRLSSFIDAGQLYQVNFAPASLSKGTADSLVLFSRGSSGYENNKALDARGRGVITVGDMRMRLAKVAEHGEFKAHAAKLRAIDPAAKGPVIAGPFEFPWSFVGIVGSTTLVAVGLYGWQAGWHKALARKYKELT